MASSLRFCHIHYDITASERHSVHEIKSVQSWPLTTSITVRARSSACASSASIQANLVFASAKNPDNVVAIFYHAVLQDQICLGSGVVGDLDKRRIITGTGLEKVLIARSVRAAAHAEIAVLQHCDSQI